MKSVSQQLDVGPILATTIGRHLEIMPKLQDLLSQRPLPKLDPVNTDRSVFQAVSGACMTAPTATIITNLLLTHVRTKNGRIDTLRANPLYVFSEVAYPVVEWTETDNSKNIAIFYIEDQKGCGLSHEDPKECREDKQKCVPCRLSWIMLSVINTAENGEKSRLNWSVSHLSHIRRLFSLAQHLYGVSQWSNEDKLALYCHQTLGHCELTELFFFFNLLLIVLGKRDVPRCCTNI